MKMKKSTMKVILVIVGVILIAVACCALGGLVIWGVGNALLEALSIDYQLTYWASVLIALVISIVTKACCTRN